MSDASKNETEIISENSKSVTKQQDIIPSNWVRSSARFVDLHLPALIIWYLLAIFYPELYRNLVNNKLISLSFAVVIPVFIESFLYTVLAWTPGKALFGINVVNRYNNKLTAKEYYQRNLRFLHSGIAYGVPIVWLFTVSKQQRRFSQGLPASYDEESGDRVVYKRKSGFRLFVANLVTLFIAGIVFYGYFLDTQEKNNSRNIQIEAASGDSKAQYQYAEMLLEGNGVEKDEKLAVEYLIKSANGGYGDAQVALASFYLQGLYVEKNLTKGKEWAEKASAHHLPIAYNLLSLIYLGEFDNAMINYDQAFLWSKKSADTGLAAGKINLAICYLNGFGCKANHNKAIDLLKEAESQGEASASEILKKLNHKN